MPDETPMNERVDERNELLEWAREVLLRWPVDLGYATPRWAKELRERLN